MKKTEPEKDEPIGWFYLLQRAIEVGDYAAAAEAQRELKRLGVEVRFVRQTREVAHAER